VALSKDHFVNGHVLQFFTRAAYSDTWVVKSASQRSSRCEGLGMVAPCSNRPMLPRWISHKKSNSTQPYSAAGVLFS